MEEDFSKAFKVVLGNIEAIIYAESHGKAKSQFLLLHNISKKKWLEIKVNRIKEHDSKKDKK